MAFLPSVTQRLGWCNDSIRLVTHGLLWFYNDKWIVWILTLKEAATWNAALVSAKRSEQFVTSIQRRRNQKSHSLKGQESSFLHLMISEIRWSGSGSQRDYEERKMKRYNNRWKRNDIKTRKHKEDRKEYANIKNRMAECVKSWVTQIKQRNGSENKTRLRREHERVTENCMSAETRWGKLERGIEIENAAATIGDLRDEYKIWTRRIIYR